MSLFATWVCLFVNIVCLSVRSSLRARLLVCGLVCVQGLFFSFSSSIACSRPGDSLFMFGSVSMCLCVFAIGLLLECFAAWSLCFSFFVRVALYYAVVVWSWLLVDSLVHLPSACLLVSFLFQTANTATEPTMLPMSIDKTTDVYICGFEKNTALGTDPKPYGLRLKL